MNDQKIELRLIEDMLNEAARMNEENMKEFMIGEKRFKEQWLLGQFTILYNRENEQKNHFVYALKYPENMHDGATPDFGLYNHNKEWLIDLEITEALDEGRPRDDEYKEIRGEGGCEDIPETDYVPQVQAVINKKCEKKYPRETSLLVYINVLSQIYDQDGKQYSNTVTPGGNSFCGIWLFDGEKIFSLLGATA